MEAFFFGLLLFCVTIVSGSGLVELEAKTRVLVEGQHATFECRYMHSGEQKEVFLSWHLISSRFRHPVSNLSVPLFESPSGGPHPVSAGPFRFQLAPRRDFEGNWLVCNSSDGGEAKLTFGRIQKTIKIDVIMPTHTFLVMKKRPAGSTETVFCCTVKTPFDNRTMEMLIYMFDGKFPLKGDGNGTFCYELQWKPADDFWTYMSCVVRSPYGTVYSQMGESFFFNPTFQPVQSEFFNNTVTITVCYSDLRLPISNDTFQIFQFDDKKKPSKRVKIVNVAFSTDGLCNEKEKRKKYTNINAKITIAPDSIGRFQLFFVVVEHKKPYRRPGPTFTIFSNFAEISQEKLEDSKVTLGAFARLFFNLRVSVEPRKDQVSVEGPSGLPLPPEDFRFTFNRNSEAAKLEFVVRWPGRYRVVVRLLQVVAIGDQHQIETEGLKLLPPAKPVEVDFDCDVVVPFIYSGRQQPAFPERAFEVLKVDENGKTLRTDIGVSLVNMTRTGKRSFSGNVTFSPKCPGFFQVTLKNQAGRCSVRVKNISTSTEPAKENGVSLTYQKSTFTIVSVILGVTCATLLLVLFGSFFDLPTFIGKLKSRINHSNLVNWLRGTQKTTAEEESQIPLVNNTIEPEYVSFFMECKWGFKFLLKLKWNEGEVSGSQLKAAVRSFFGDVKLGQSIIHDDCGDTFVETAFDGKFVNSDGRELTFPEEGILAEIPDTEMFIPQNKMTWIKVTRDNFDNFPRSRGFEGIDEQIQTRDEKDYSWIVCHRTDQQLSYVRNVA